MIRKNISADSTILTFSNLSSLQVADFEAQDPLHARGSRKSKLLFNIELIIPLVIIRMMVAVTVNVDQVLPLLFKMLTSGNFFSPVIPISTTWQKPQEMSKKTKTSGYVLKKPQAVSKKTQAVCL